MCSEVGYAWSVQSEKIFRKKKGEAYTDVLYMPLLGMTDVDVASFSGRC